MKASWLVIPLLGAILVGRGAFLKREEMKELQALQPAQVKSIVYFENYPVNDAKEIAEFTSAIHKLHALAGSKTGSGVPFDVQLKDGKTIHWRVGALPKSQQVWVETPAGAILNSDEFTLACKHAHFPL